MKRIVVALAGILGVAALWYFKPWRPAPTIVPATDLAALRKQVEQARASSDRTVETYKPATPRVIDAMDAAEVASVLRTIPLVADVQVHGPKHRNTIIHFRDWHFVPCDAFIIDQEHVHGGKLTDEQIDGLYAQHLAQVEIMQLEQVAILRCLIRHHGLTAVFVEGMTAQADALPAVIESLQQKNEYAKLLREQRKEAEELPGGEKLLAEIDALLEQARREHLEAGAAIRLVALGELKEVLPLGDAETLQAANPVRDGKIHSDPASIRLPRDAMVRNATKRRVAVVILGGSHDLTDHVDAAQYGYVRVTTKGYPGEDQP